MLKTKLRVVEVALIFVLQVSFCFGESPPRTYTEFENYLSNEKVITKRYQSSGSSETYVLVGITNPENGEATLYRSVVSGVPTYEWTVLLKDGFNFFDEPVKSISVSARNTRHIFVQSESGEIYFTTDGGFSFVKSESLDEAQNKTHFEALVKDFDLSSEFQASKTNPSKYTNQINDLPPYAPTVWDTILWDSTETLLTSNIPSGWLAFMHGRIEVDDSGFVHIAAVKEDRLLRYFRSTDYGVSFEPEVVLEDTIGGVREVVVTANNVYLYSGSSISLDPTPDINLFVSPDKGVTWNSPTKYPYASHFGFTARSDTAYDYQESGAGGSIYQARSYDSGATFQPYETIADTIYASIQTPKIAIGGNSILLCRVGDDVSLSDNFAYRSFDLGNTWLPPFNITPPNIDSQFPDVYFHSGKFHFSEGFGFAVYNRSDDFGNSFTPHWLLCLPTDNCAVDEQQQITAHENNVFVTFVDPSEDPKYRMLTRFSRDDGDNWSQVQISSKEDPNFPAVGTWISTAVDDSIFYVVYRAVDYTVGDPFGVHELTFRRGFYKFPFLSFEPDTLKINSQFLPSQLNTNFTVRNTGVIDLEVSQIELPSWITLLSDSSFTLQPDSTKQIEIQLDLTQPLLEAELLFHTNQQIDSIRSFVVLVDTVITDLGEKENLPNKFSLSQNYPNPFNPTTTINYELQITNYEKSELIIYNILGEEVKSWKLSSSSGEVVWNGTDNFGNPVSSGVYLYRLTNGSFNKTKKMVLLK